MAFFRPTRLRFYDEPTPTRLRSVITTSRLSLLMFIRLCRSSSALLTPLFGLRNPLTFSFFLYSHPFLRRGLHLPTSSALFPSFLRRAPYVVPMRTSKSDPSCSYPNQRSLAAYPSPISTSAFFFFLWISFYPLCALVGRPFQRAEGPSFFPPKQVFSSCCFEVGSRKIKKIIILSP